MVRAARSFLRDPRQRIAHDPAKRPLDHLVVLKQILRHRPSPALSDPRRRMK
jgi:hypothetical protein